MARTGVRRIVPLTYGWEDLPKSISVHGADPRIRLREPVPGVLLQVDGGWFLLDTGFNDALVHDPLLRARFHGAGIVPELPGSGDGLVDAFDLVGVAIDDVVAVAVSHLHNDHAGGLKHFAGRVPVHAQALELAYGLHAPHPEPERNGIFRVDFDDDRIDWRVAEGDVELAPGLTAVLTAGHTPGHQSFVVDLDDDAAEAAGCPGYVLAFDAADLQENIDDEVAVGGFIDCEPGQTVEAIRRLKAIAAEKGYRLVPGHDPHVWPALADELGVPTFR